MLLKDKATVGIIKKLSSPKHITLEIYECNYFSFNICLLFHIASGIRCWRGRLKKRGLIVQQCDLTGV